MSCDHKFGGDYVHGIWICGHCFSALHARPVKYGMVAAPFGTGGRQAMIWQARVVRNKDGATLGRFVLWMISYLRVRSFWTISKDEARQQCLEILRDMSEPFGSADACWSRQDAKELVREGICAYWDEAPSGANT